MNQIHVNKDLFQEALSSATESCLKTMPAAGSHLKLQYSGHSKKQLCSPYVYWLKYESYIGVMDISFEIGNELPHGRRS